VTSGGNNFNDFPEIQFTELSAVKLNWDQNMSVGTQFLTVPVQQELE